MLNNIVLMGRLTASPIPRGTGDRLAAAFVVAVQRDYKDKNGERSADFIDCVAFGKLGEHILGYYDKGQMIALRGRLESGTYTRNDGSSIKTYHVVVSDCWFCGDRKTATPTSAQTNECAPSNDQSLDDTYPFF